LTSDSSTVRPGAADFSSALNNLLIYNIWLQILSLSFPSLSLSVSLSFSLGVPWCQNKIQQIYIRKLTDFYLYSRSF
jgi:hypothetical protein